MTPTDEQAAAVTAAATGHPLVIEALAGTGKTSTLQLIAEDAPATHMQYVAFNKAIVNDAVARMPGNVACSTAHGLAFRAVGRRYAHRLGGQRMRSTDIARRLGVDPLWITVGDRRRHLAAGWLASQAVQAVRRFCQTADPTPTVAHIGWIDGLDDPQWIVDPITGARRRVPGPNQLAVRDHLAKHLDRVWADWTDPDGTLPYDHGAYLKQWQLGSPRIDAEVILFDEAQDANPVMAAIVEAQADAQVIFVGDTLQAIYEFTGAVNAMAAHHGARCWLTRSFRFGSEIADVANTVLAEAGATVRVVGAGPSGVVGEGGRVDAVLCRTNAGVIGEVMAELGRGGRPAVVGGVGELVAFARAAGDLLAGRGTAHPQLACFDSWGDVRSYVADDPAGSELKLLVDLVDEFSPGLLVERLSALPDEECSSLVVSTAHKAKGRQWPSVRLSGDFPPFYPDIPPFHPDGLLEGLLAGDNVGELRLLYVAVTRAQRRLDVSALPGLAEAVGA